MRLALVALGLVLLPFAPALARSPHPPEGGKCVLGELNTDNTVDMHNCPAEVKDVIDRALNCQHWTGEDPYDNARAHEIETAIAELKCDELSVEHDALLKKYRSDRAVIEAMQDADREYNLEF